MTRPEKLSLARLPTPLDRLDRLAERWGGPPIYVKRDDLTGFGLSGNKVRKLEYHFAAALRAGAKAVLTCGAVQSNHCRATAVASARLGLECVLFLRTPDGEPPPQILANHLIDTTVGATVHFVDPSWYRARDERMAAHAAGMDRPAWVIPEGASDGLGAWGYDEAGAELERQLRDEGLDTVVQWHAAASGGTTAGLAHQAAVASIDSVIVAVSVADPAAQFARRIAQVREDAVGPDVPALSGDRLVIRDDYIGGGYGVATREELAVQAEVSAQTGLLFDPTYTGKALYALRKEIAAGSLDPAVPVVFWHTGGGFALFAGGPGPDD